MNANPELSQNYQAQLADAYGDEFVAEVTHWKSAEIPEQPGQEIPYTRINQHEQSVPMLYVPGFGETIVNKASFAGELAKKDVDVILPGQNRHGKGLSREDATEIQAANYLAVLEAEKLTHTKVNVAAHSFGSLVFDKMAQIARERGWTCFDDATVFLLAPAGLYEDDSLGKLARRQLKMVKSEGPDTPKDFPDLHGETAKASQKTLLANPARTVREVGRLIHGRVDIEGLVGNKETRGLIGKLVILGYAEDELYGARVKSDSDVTDTSIIGPRVARAFEHADAADMGEGAHKPLGEIDAHEVDAEIGSRIIYATPVSHRKMPDGNIRSGAGATHDDEQLNPERVTDAMLQILRAEQDTTH
jgi:hypothetical protein